MKKILFFIIVLLVNCLIIFFLKYIKNWNLISYTFGIIFQAISYALFEIGDVYNFLKR